MTSPPATAPVAPRRPLSVNRNAEALAAAMIERADALGIDVSVGAAGETLIDAGARARGSFEAGRLLTEICLGGLGRAAIVPDAALPRHPWAVAVESWQPVTACLGSQYAGWRLTEGEGENGYFAMGSGPARALAGEEPLFTEIGHAESHDGAVLVLETGSPPPPALVRRIAAACRVAPGRLRILYAPTQSLAGTVQIVGRVLEVALHKAHVLRFDLGRIAAGMGAAPLPPPHPDFVTAMGRTNDAVIYGGRVLLHVTGPAADARALAEALPSRTSADHGALFAEIFRRNHGDFYAIDGSLFSPAAVTVVALETGETFRAGAVDAALVDASFG